MEIRRSNTSLLAACERRLLAYLVKRLPQRTTPDHLTLFGLIGSAVTCAGFILCAATPYALVLVELGLLANWFGDSLDGSLARHRQIERPRYGFFIDHSSDLLAQSLIIVGLGLSPYFTLASALFVLSVYMLMSSYTYLRAAVEGLHRLAYGGMGATEFRILVGAWALLVQCVFPQISTGQIFGYHGLDVAIAALCFCAYIAFALMVRTDLRRLNLEEPAGGSKGVKIVARGTPRDGGDAAAESANVSKSTGIVGSKMSPVASDSLTDINLHPRKVVGGVG
jgi:archaetidylinositol phosphate synthase